MSRMTAALKALSQRLPVAAEPPASPAAAPPPPAPQSPAPDPPAPPAPDPLPAQLVQLVNLDALELAVTELLSVELFTPPVEEPPACEPQTPPPALPGPAALESAVHRHLAIPSAAHSYQALAETIDADLAGRSSMSVLFSRAESDPDLAETIFSLAVTWAQRGRRMLIVDADRRQRLLTRRLQVLDRKGWTDSVQQPEQWTDAIVSVADGAIHFLPAGMGTGVDVAATPQLPLLLNRWKQDYPLVLIAGGSGDDPLERTLISHSDGTYLLVRLGTTNKWAAEQAADALRQQGARLLGAIVTNVGQ